MEVELKGFLKSILKDGFGIETAEIKLELPPKKELGDFAFGVFLLAKELKKAPQIIAEEIKEYIDNLDDDKNNIIQELSVAGPYINIKLNKGNYTESFIKFIENKKEVESNGKTIVIDYIGANVGKPMHIGHMCTPNIGQAMINIYKYLGYNVISDSHIGDWGIIFGKLITAYKKWGDKDLLEKDAVNYLLELYIKITSEAEQDDSLEEEARQEFKKLSIGDNDSIELWKDFTRYSIDAMQIMLNRLNVIPDYNIGESFYEGIGLPKLEDNPDLKYSMKMIVSELLEKNIATKNEDNSVGVVFDDDLKMPSCILQKRDGAHGYLASDLAAIKYRIENWKPSKIVYFVDVRQQLHLKQAFEISSQASWSEKTELIHAYNGFISLKDGAMSTRKGRIIKLDKLLDEARDRAKKIILEKRDDINGTELDNLAETIGIGAIKYGYLKKSRDSDVIFDWDEFMSFEGNSGPYIQYAYVRSKSILSKSGIDLNGLNYDFSDIKFESEYEIDLLKYILGFNDILISAIKNNEPHILAKYAYDLTKSFNSFYNNINILKEENINYKILKVLLVSEFSKTLKKAFELVGIKMPEKM